MKTRVVLDVTEEGATLVSVTIPDQHGVPLTCYAPPGMSVPGNIRIVDEPDMERAHGYGTATDEYAYPHGAKWQEWFKGFEAIHERVILDSLPMTPEYIARRARELYGPFPEPWLEGG